MEARDRKITRCAGITGHADPSAMRAALERYGFDCVQMALNGARARMGRRRGRGHSHGGRQLRGPGPVHATPRRRLKQA